MNIIIGGARGLRGPFPPPPPTTAFETFHYSSFTFVNKSKNYTKNVFTGLASQENFLALPRNIINIQ